MEKETQCPKCGNKDIRTGTPEVILSEKKSGEDVLISNRKVNICRECPPGENTFPN